MAEFEGELRHEDPESPWYIHVADGLATKTTKIEAYVDWAREGTLLGVEILEGMPPRQRLLPKTREELAVFFGDLRLSDGACVTGILVECALEILRGWNEQP